MLNNGLVGLVFNGESSSSGMADHPNHSDRILLKSFTRITDGSNDPSLEVCDSANIIYNREICNIVEKAINRDVPAQGILRGRSKTVCPDDIPFFRFYLFKFWPAPKSGYLDDLSPSKKYLDLFKSAANDPAVFKEGIDLMGVSIGGDIKIFWDPFQEEVPDASPDEIG